MKRKELLAATAGAVVATVLVGGAAWAAIPGPGGVIQGCYDSGGNVKVVETLPCPKGYTPFQWNQLGPQGPPGPAGEDGEDGVGPTVAQLAAGDSNCPAGGAAITDAAANTAYVCGGQDGADGQPFTGTFTSPNGEYSILVTDAGITIGHGTSNRITLTGDDLTVRSEDIDVQSALSTQLKAGTTATVDATGNLTLKTSGSGLVRATGPLDLQGSVVNIN